VLTDYRFNRAWSDQMDNLLLVVHKRVFSLDQMGSH